MFSLLLAVALAIPLSSISQSTSLSPFQPQVALYSYWDFGSQSWGDTTFRHTHAYQGNLELPSLITVEQKQGTWNNLLRLQRQFNAAGDVSSLLGFVWSNGQWVDDGELHNYYNVQGDLTLQVELDVSGAVPDTVDVLRNSYHYDSAGHVLEQIQELKFASSPAFVFTDRWEYVYDSSGTLVAEGHCEWEDNLNIWNRQYWKRDMVWRDSTQTKPLEFYQDYYSNNFLHFTLLQRFEYGLGESVKHYELKYNDQTMAYDSTRKFFSYTDQYGHLDYYESYLWDDFFNVWQVIDLEKYTRVLNADHHPIWVEKEYWSTTAFEWRYESRVDYPVFWVQSKPELAVSNASRWFPNPASENSTLEVDAVAGPLQLEIVDLQGRVLRRVVRMHQGGLARYPMQFNLPDGTYAYRLSVGNRVDSGTLVIRR